MVMIVTLRLLFIISLSYRVVCLVQADDTCSNADDISFNDDVDPVADKYKSNGNMMDCFHAETEIVESNDEITIKDVPETEVPGDLVGIIHDEHQSHDHIVDKEPTENMFPKLHRIEPGKVGNQVELELEPGQFYTRITKAVQPPIFVVPNFLSDEECDNIIAQAAKRGLVTSHLFRTNVVEEYKKKKNRDDITRISEQTWLHKKHFKNDFYTQLQNRISKLTEMPKFLLQRSEAITVVSYKPGGHYHAHYDTTKDGTDLPCCGQVQCDDSKLFPGNMYKCCKICRFITVMFYLNEPEVGGETAFPLADLSDEMIEEKEANINESKWNNLSRSCHNASLRISPKRGMAVMWYNHVVDEETSYLGPSDERSIHGGCNIIKGTKWIANYWIVGTPYEDRFKPSVWFKNNE